VCVCVCLCVSVCVPVVRCDVCLEFRLVEIHECVAAWQHSLREVKRALLCLSTRTIDSLGRPDDGNRTDEIPTCVCVCVCVCVVIMGWSLYCEHSPPRDQGLGVSWQHNESFTTSVNVRITEEFLIIINTLEFRFRLEFRTCGASAIVFQIN